MTTIDQLGQDLLAASRLPVRIQLRKDGRLLAELGFEAFPGPEQLAWLRRIAELYRIPIEPVKKCDRCGGDGLVPVDPFPCPDCKGTGMAAGPVADAEWAEVV